MAIHSSSSGAYIPLGNMSRTSFPSTKTSYALSEASTLADSAYLLSPSSTIAFKPNSTVQIQSNGKRCLSLPTPSAELLIPIFSTTITSTHTSINDNHASQIRTDRPVYLSIRPSRHSGTSRLVLASDQTEAPIARTEFRWGPGRPPVIRLGADDDIDTERFEMRSVSVWTRSVEFELFGLGDGRFGTGKFVWRYGNRKERAEQSADNLLILEKLAVVEGHANRKVAQLVRGEGTRTPGTGRRCEGNGGRLEMNLRLEEGGQIISEVAVVVTCLVMLKKEMDR